VEDIYLHLSRKYKNFVKTNTTPGAGLGEVSSIPTARKPKLVILGCGWGGHAQLKTIDTDKYDVLVISPRNHFLFTPMLPGTATGSIEFRSIIECVRSTNEFADYYEAAAVRIDLARNTLVCRSVRTGDEFDVYYDYLSIAVGATTNTFGTPGVTEYCHFFKDIDDAKVVRKELVDCFETANTPNISPEEQKRLLTFVVVGAGPTGCELAACLSDFLAQDVKRYYPKMVSSAQVKLINSGDKILSQFDSVLQSKTLQNFEKAAIQVIMNARVIRVGPKSVTIRNSKTGEEEDIPYGMCVWAAGNGVNPFVKHLIDLIPEQKEAKGRLILDPWLRVKGTENVFSFGDCATTAEPLPPTGQVAAQQGSYVARLLNRNVCLKCEVPVMLPSEYDNTMQKSEFEALQASSNFKFRFAKPFEFLSLGILAYIGGNEAIAGVEAGDVKLGNMSGFLAYLLYQSVYLTKQVSTRNRLLVLFDNFKAKIFGRDISMF